MLKKLIQFSLDHAALVLVMAGVVLAFAAFRLPKTPVDVFPELNAPTVATMAEAAGLAADEVEQYVTFPIEISVNGIPGVRRVRPLLLPAGPGQCPGEQHIRRKRSARHLHRWAGYRPHQPEPCHP